MKVFAVGQTVWIRSAIGVTRGKIACLIMPGHLPDGFEGRDKVVGATEARRELSYVVLVKSGDRAQTCWPETSTLVRL
jgi:hypothetical protein